MPNNSALLAIAPDPLPGTDDTPQVFPAPSVGVAANSTRTDVLATPVEFFILGPRRSPDEPPLWAVRARLLQWATDTRGLEDSWYSRACRLLFIDRDLPASPAQQLLLPGTFVARCRILTARITINGLTFDLAGPTQTPVEVDLLLWAVDADWSLIVPQDDDSAPANRSFTKLHLDQAVCLAGEIPIASFAPHPDMPPGSPPWNSRLEMVGGQPVLTRVGNAALSSSGLAFEAVAVLPWGPPPIANARYLAEVVLKANAPAPSPTDPPPTLVVVPDLDRLDDPSYQQARVGYLNAFADLATILQPAPNPGPHLSTRQRPRWVRLEPTAPGILPGFSWFLDSGPQGRSASARFEFDPGAWRLAVSDQPAGIAGVSPQGVLSAAAILDIPYGQAGAGLTATITPAPLSSPSPPPMPATGSSLRYALTRPADGYHESISIAEAETAYDPIAVAAALRRIAEVPTPDLEAPPPPTAGDRLGGGLAPATTAGGLVAPQILFGLMPLDEGWAQLPFLNVTDQILTDILPEPAPASAVVSPFSGAASFGTDRAELFDASRGEPAWAVSVLDARDFRGTWTLQARVLTGIVLELDEPKLFLKGLFWLATAAPTPEDALPSLDDFLGAIQGVTLQTPDPTDIYPSPFVLRFHELTFNEGQSTLADGYSSASIAAVDFSYAANDAVFDAIFNSPAMIFDLKTFWTNLPLAWRRHRTVPAIQSLPLTQTKTPPNSPSASRQLFPFALNVNPSTNRPGPDDWTFHSDDGSSWPRLTSTAPSAISGPGRDGLALLALGLPGLAWDPVLTTTPFVAADPDDGILPAQYRHEVALLDEVNALATLPKEDKPPDPGATPPSPPPALRREDYDAFWTHQADLAFFATAEARDALTIANGQAVVRGLIEPFDWPVTATLTAAPYPGSIRFQDPNGRPPVVLAGAKDDALRGLEGTFRRTATAGRIELIDAASAEFTVVGEAMAATLDAGSRIRDQRGLYREASRIVVVAPTTSWITTRVGLRDDPGSPAIILWTAMAPFPLSVGSADTWNLWVRDLPAVDAGGMSNFARPTGGSSQRRDENDPAAPNRTLNHLNGYEWRLGFTAPSITRGGVPDPSPLPIGPLWFFPLSIESATFDPVRGMKSVAMIGRLHLPFADDPLIEPQDRSNAVLVTFDDGMFSMIAIAPPDFDGPPPATPPAPFNDWPLADPSTRPGAPVFRWTRIDPEGTPPTGLVVTGQVVYTRHGVSWTFPAQKIHFPFDGSTPTVEPPPISPLDGAAISIQSALLVLNFSGDATKPRGHNFTVSWQFTWGQVEQLRLVATHREAVLPPTLPPGTSPAPATSAALQVRETVAVALALQDAEILPPNLDGGAVQIQWSGIMNPAATVQILPGFHLNPDPERASRGFATLAFNLADNPGDLPQVDRPSGGYLEALFGCDWGYPLQSPPPSRPDLGGVSQRVFGSSAGRVDAAYTATFLSPAPPPPPPPSATLEHRWSPRLLLNGFVEVKDLASWPVGLVPDPTDNLVTLPAARPAAANAPGLGHVRHTARILFQQHEAPVDASFMPGPTGTTILLTIKPLQCWTLRAVVEHQFIRLDLDTAVPPAPVPPDRGAPIFETRVTQVQEVRLCAPSAFRAMLDEMVDQATADIKFSLAGLTPGAQSSNVLVRLVPGAARGYLSRPMLNRFRAGAAGTVVDLADGDTLIVEASVPVMVRTSPVTAGAPSGLAYLPGGTTQGYLAALRDYQSPIDDPRDQPQSWTLLPLTFLGRLQPRDSDGIPAAPPPPARADQLPTLKVDPILWIAIGRSTGVANIDPVARTLANWRDTQALSIRLAEFDLARHRRFTRLDPSSLRESWFRLHLPPPSLSRTSATAGGQAPPIETVLAAPPTDEVAAMSRPDVVARLLDPGRPALPPDARGQPGAPDDDIPTSIEWHPGGLYLFDLAGSIFADGSTGLSDDIVTQYAFIGVAAQLEQAALVSAAKGPVRRPSATILRSPSSSAGSGAVQPVSAAVSPFLGLDFQPSVVPKAPARPLLSVTELVGFDVARRQVVSIGSKLWDPPSITGDLDPFIRAWGRDIQSRMAADSPAAVIRVREIHSNPPAFAGGPPPGVTVVYRFLAPEALVPPPAPARRAPALRANPASIRHVQGQYGGPVPPPEALAPFELAPPQVVGVQPLRLATRPGNGAVGWPWGLSAYRFSVLQSAGGEGIAGPVLTLPDSGSSEPFDGRLWWESLHQAVQYVVPDPASGRRILPTLFRAQAMPGLLPTWPSSLLPDRVDVKTALETQVDTPAGAPAVTAPAALIGWQPVLPGGHVVILAGARPGAPFAFRQSIQTQSLGDDKRSVVSGSVPVMHRPPRPVPLPANDPNRPEIALQTSAGAFGLGSTVAAKLSPRDSAYLGGAAAASGLDLVLYAADPTTSGKSIGGGIIPAGPKGDSGSNWDGVLRFQAESHGSSLADWFGKASISLQSTNPRTGVSTILSFNPPAGPGGTTGQVEIHPNDLNGLTNWLGATSHGDSAVVRVSVGIDGMEPADVKNFRQELAFPLRVAFDQGVNALPYRPAFLLFEDPQYNRRLASVAAQAQSIVTITVTKGANPPTIYAPRITLSADRHAYNPAGQIHYLFFFDPPLPDDVNKLIRGTFQFGKINPVGVSPPSWTYSPPISPSNTLPDPVDQDLGTIQGKASSNDPLSPGETLVLKLTLSVIAPPPPGIAVKIGGGTLSLSLPVVAEPVNPVPEAGYALLRKNPDGSVECVRFAFSPEAGRIELIDPNDLHGQNVRRRAVFTWRDTLRTGQVSSYAIQKVTTGGSTHFPMTFEPLSQPEP